MYLDLIKYYQTLWQEFGKHRPLYMYLIYVIYTYNPNFTINIHIHTRILYSTFYTTRVDNKRNIYLIVTLP